MLRRNPLSSYSPARALSAFTLVTALSSASLYACGSDEVESTFDAASPDSGKPPGNNLPPLGNGDGGGGLDSAFDPDAACATGTVAATRSPAYLQLVVDGSGSMDGFDGANYLPNEREPDPEVTTPRNDLKGQPTMDTGKKWIALRGALTAFFDDLAQRQDPYFAVGMYLFSSNSLKSATGIDVPISYVNAAHATALKARLHPPVFPGGGTPLLASINGQLPILNAYAPVAPVKPNGKRVLVVITDGVPTVGQGQNQAQANADVIASVQGAKNGNPPVTSFTIGVGNPTGAAVLFDELFLGKIAVAGGTEEPGCDPNWGDQNMSGKPCHLQVTPGAKTAAQIKQEFIDAFNNVRDKTTSCELLLDTSDAQNLDPTKVNVFLTTNGKEKPVAKGPQNGWSYDNEQKPTKVILNGQSCADLKSDPNSSARLVVGCASSIEVPK